MPDAESPPDLRTCEVVVLRHGNTVVRHSLSARVPWFGAERAPESEPEWSRYLDIPEELEVFVNPGDTIVAMVCAADDTPTKRMTFPYLRPIAEHRRRPDADFARPAYVADDSDWTDLTGRDFDFVARFRRLPKRGGD